MNRLKGQALGLGEYGVEAKVETAIEHIVDSFNLIKQQLTDIQADGVNKIELDVFGFSRGAAAARHFINVVLDGEQGEFVPKFVGACQQNELALQAGFHMIGAVMSIVKWRLRGCLILWQRLPILAL